MFIQSSEVFANLGQLIRQIKVIKENPIDPQRYGGELLEEELYRVITDQRVMGLHENEEETLKKEWAIVCDLSGSTNTRIGGNTLWVTELCAAKGAFESLRDAREEVTVYAHSTWRGTTLYKIANTRDIEIDRRFDAAAKVHKGSNYDDEILEWIAKNGFKFSDSMKIVIMLSDGQPCGVGGVNTLHDLVEQLRKRGYVIISVSMVDEVVRKNNEIYGKEWNIVATHGDIDGKLRELFIKLSKEFKVR